MEKSGLGMFVIGFTGLLYTHAITTLLAFLFVFLSFYDMVAKSIGDDINYKQLLILPFDN